MGDLSLVSVPPCWLEISLDLFRVGVVKVSWGESNKVVTFLVDRLHLGREEEGVRGGRVVAHVKGGDTDRVTGGDESGRSDRGVEQDKREHSVEHVA